jgi:hypothetical protein
MVGYLQAVSEKGEATYRGQHTANLNADRLVVSSSNRAIVLECYGKSLDQLRSPLPLQRMPASP